MKRAVRSRSPWLVLAVLSMSVFTITIDTTIVNVALPTLVRAISATTTQLQWIVDAYNLTFAAFVLAAGGLSDRFGRRGSLLVGLLIFGGGTAAGALSTTPGQLITARAVMGVGAAVVFPATLSIITNVFTERKPRAAAIGIWGAVSGIGVACGPILGGWLLEHFWWGSVFAAMIPLAVVGIALTIAIVPTSRDPRAPRLDVLGLVLSTVAVATLVYTIIEAPDRGWTSPVSVAGWIGAGALFVALVLWERRVAQPMLDVRLFVNLRFSAASAAVTVAFFNLSGFIFLATQYFQFLKLYSPLGTGVRFIPVAGAIAIGSVLGSRFGVKIGAKTVVAGGLSLLAIAYAWISTMNTATSYLEIAGQMLVLGSGLGLTSAAATEAIMGVVPPEKAGVGSAVNDATRQLGGTLGVAVLGSIYASLYHSGLSGVPVAGVPAPAVDAARDSLGAALTVGERLVQAGASGPAASLVRAATDGFYDGLHTACLVAAAISAVAAVAVLAWLPAHPHQPESESESESEPESEPESDAKADAKAGASTKVSAGTAS